MTGLLTGLRFMVTHGRFPVRDRYWTRRSGRLRLRYVVATYGSLSALLSFMVMSVLPLGASINAPTLASYQTTSSNSIPVLAVVTPQTKPTTGIPSPLMKPTPVAAILRDHRDDSGQIRRSTDTRLTQEIIQTQSSTPSHGRLQNLTIAAGDTLSTLLVRAGMSNDDSDRAIRALRPHLASHELRPGQTLQLEMAADQAPYQFNRLALAVDPVRTIEVKRGWGGFMTAAVMEKPLKSDVAAQTAVIKASLYGAASAAGIPNNVTAEAIKAFGHQIDFQRDIHPGDRLEIMYDRMVTNDGYVARTGNLVFARLFADDRELSIYRFESQDGRVDYYDDKGHSIRKALLRTPMDGARLSSGYGMRKHPILGYSKMHKGVDFAAATGTPVYAAGDGVIEKSGRFGAYGNYVRLRHNAKLQTAYAHLSRFGKGISPGTRVRQGQVIGYVGTTGRSTGPHLHYEILVGGDHVNPSSVKLPTMVMLDGADRKKFKALVDRLNREFREKTNGIRYAAIDTPSTP
jgi:murein DD-endopeptidase MepM/ murein hydrolase activator NlpD